jgi:excisionase family DNA binding protein
MNHTCLDEIVSLAEAAQQLDLGPSTLRAQADRGRLEARRLGKTWITTKAEVERYRRENLGNVGGPKGS